MEVCFPECDRGSALPSTRVVQQLLEPQARSAQAAESAVGRGALGPTILRVIAVQVMSIVICAQYGTK